MKHWDYQTDIAWDRFDASKIDPSIVPLVKAAALVEYNGGQYAEHLAKLFAGDEEFCKASIEWGLEETQHGNALGKWANLADPSFDLESAFARFTAGYQVPVSHDGASLRGSKSGEMIARCIVETGTSSYYTALMESTDEPVLKEICRHIAADEFRHYKLFYQHFKKYLEIEKIGFLKRLRIALGRVSETEDDELSYAYFAANTANDNAIYDRELYNKRYKAGAYSYYRHHHIERAVGMVLKAVGMKAGGRANRLIADLAYKKIRRNLQKLDQELKQAA